MLVAVLGGFALLCSEDWLGCCASLIRYVAALGGFAALLCLEDWRNGVT